MLKYVHTNIVARDWKKLARFYIEVFDCEPVPPERDLKGDWLDRLTALKNARIQGVHLRLPGYPNDGPTLEIFQYNQTIDSDIQPAVNRPGLAHLAFFVDDVEFYCRKLVEHGGSLLGEIVATTVEGVGVLTVAYAKDPEQNIVEIQNWR